MNTRKLPRKVLIDALAGDDVCPTCRGRGWLQVTNERDRRPCPACRGTGLTDAKQAAPAYISWNLGRTRRKATREVRS